MKFVDIDKIYKILEKETKNYNVPVADLVRIQTNDPFKILITTILSARTNDKTTAIVIERLFKEIKNFADIDRTSENNIQKLIYPVGFYRTKAKNLKKLPKIINDKFNGMIPINIDDLLTLPGVGRKTANIVLNLAFDKDAIAVDVHCHRIFNRLGYIKTKTPHETEFELRKKLKKKYWKKINYIFVAYGQNICRPINPKCSKCAINNYCNKINVKTKY